LATTTAGYPPPPGLSAVQPATHLRYLDGLRAAAALFVVLHHTWLEAGLAYNVLGHYAVGLFIVLSGFCLMLPVIRGDGTLPGGPMHFFRKRARRILPPYYAALALSVVLAYTVLSGHGEPVSGAGLVTHALLVHNLSPHTTLQFNGPLWSVAVECHIYLLFPLLVWGFRKAGPVAATGLVLIFSFLLARLLFQLPVNTDMHGASPQFLGLFACGMLAARVSLAPTGRATRFREKFPWEAAVVVSSLLLLVPAWGWYGQYQAHYLVDYLVGGWGFALLVCIHCRRPAWLYEFLSWRPLVFVGTFAYSIYLVHLPVLQLLRVYGGEMLGASGPGLLALLTAAGLPLVLGASYLFYQYCERPFLRPANHPSRQ
jgi:peptidoglycan/LPS O-acetylase OafA/YrhL